MAAPSSATLTPLVALQERRRRRRTTTTRVRRQTGMELHFAFSIVAEAQPKRVANRFGEILEGEEPRRGEAEGNCINRQFVFRYVCRALESKSSLPAL